MKNIINVAVKFVVSFVKAHTAIAIATASAVAVTAVAVPVGVHMAKNNNIEIAPASSSEESTDDIVTSMESIVEDVDVPESDISDVVSTPSEERVPTASEVVPVVNNTSSESNSSNAPPTVVETTSTPSASSGKVTVVQMADPNTGVSWDGKSPIVYTYTDGTTGTVPKDGATYEQVPGVVNTVTETKHVEYDGKCSDCGKTEGDGTNGTCAQWLMGDVDCPICGVHVAVRTCHTCGE